MLLNKFWKNKKVLITGNTGFKGGWLSLWLNQVGANILGISLEQKSKRSFFNVTKLDQVVPTLYIDINKFQKLFSAIREFKPDIIFHLAAQPLVIDSINDPLYTFNTNIIGTANILECIRILNIKASIICTSDKCYENNDLNRPFNEDDRLGGKDPYSTSKAGAELITNSYIKTYFNDLGSPNVASVRAGNVIGGGDFANNRIVPDIINALKTKRSIILRNPHATRPWQYVLDPLYGYIKLLEKLIDSKDYQGPWNFGPTDTSNEVSVERLATLFITKWGDKTKIKKYKNTVQESTYLKISSKKSYDFLKWSQRIDIELAISKIIAWEKAVDMNHDMLKYANNEIKNYREHLKK